MAEGHGAIVVDGRRVIFQAVDWETGASYLWMRSAAGGPLERVTNAETPNERAGSWSPDGTWYVYSTREEDGSDTLKKVRTSGKAPPETLLAGVAPSRILPVWSPDGAWILVADAHLKLVSADGHTSRELGIEAAPCGFARTAQRLYCVRPTQADGDLPFVALDFAGNVVQVIGTVARDRAPETSGGPAGADADAVADARCFERHLLGGKPVVDSVAHGWARASAVALK